MKIHNTTFIFRNFFAFSALILVLHSGLVTAFSLPRFRMPLSDCCSWDLGYADDMSERYARDYINEISHRLERELSPCACDWEIRDLRRLILDNTLRASSTYHWTMSGKRWRKEKIDLYIRSGIVQYIEKRAYDYAYAHTGNRSDSLKIAESMRNNAVAEIERHGLWRMNVLSHFVGRSLERAVRGYMNHSDMPYNQPAPHPQYQPQHAAHQLQHVYPSDECVICYEDFSTARGSAKQIFLHPCGHDLCKDCARTWLINNSQNRAQTCPTCRRQVNIETTKQQLSYAEQATWRNT